MSYLALAYPDLTESDFALVQDHRRVHDSLFFDVVDPHFSFIFAVHDFSEENFIEEIVNKANGQKKINFVIRCATISKDGFEDSYHVFLVPDEGQSDIIKLHDVLYSGSLKSNRRLDLDYIPHMAIGNSTDPYVSKRLAEEWNLKDITIKGSISRLSIIKYEDNVVTLLKEIELA
jgi:hypothetical protein